MYLFKQTEQGVEEIRIFLNIQTQLGFTEQYYLPGGMGGLFNFLETVFTFQTEDLHKQITRIYYLKLLKVISFSVSLIKSSYKSQTIQPLP